jgi:hypothetical protein
MGRLGDSAARLVFPLDSNLGTLVCATTRSYLRLYHLSRPTSEFITRQLRGAIRRLPGKSGSRPLRVSLTLRSRAGKILVALRVPSPGRAGLRLASLARGAPLSVRAGYRPGRGGGTLTFRSVPPRQA